MTDDPIDLSQVAADDAAIEQLRETRVAGDDPAMAMLRDLLHDVGGDLPQGAPLGHGSSEVIPLPNDTTPERRLVRNGTLVALVAAGALSVAGVAAASTLAPEGSPLHGLVDAVRAAAGAVIGAVTPPDTPAASSTESPGGAAVAAPTDLPSAASFDRRTTSDPRTTRPGAAAPSASAPGTAVSAATRSAAAARQVTALLDQAEALLDAGRTDAADARLDTAERRLAVVLPPDAGPLRARLTSLRERLAAATAEPRAKPTPRAEDKPAPKSKTAPQNERTDRPPQDAEPAQQSGTKKPTPRAQPSKRDDGGKGRQPSKDASAKPRA